MIVVVILGIVAALAMPMASPSATSKLQAAGRLLVADIELAQSESIAHPDDTRLLTIDPSNSAYLIAAGSAPDTPLNASYRGGPMKVCFGMGNFADLSGVTINSYDLDASDENNDKALGFDSLGRPDQSTPATIQLACEGQTLTVTVAADSGEVTASLD